jgi:5-methyltetrahydropteroyltriglutamate--homocysteine methyltransferase
VQIDFTEGRLAVKLDPSGQLLSSFIALINRVLDQFNEEE